MEKIEDMSAGEAEEHIAALYGDELYGLELDGEVSGEGAMRCACSPVHDEVRGICDMLGLDFTRVDRIATGRAGMLWAGEGMPHRFDACFEIRALADVLMVEEAAPALGALESALDSARRKGYCVFDRGVHGDVPADGLVYLCSTYPAAVGLKDSTGIDLPSLLNGLISNPDIDADSAENSVE